MKKVLLIIGGIVLVLVLSGASFYGGTVYERSQRSNAANRFFAQRGMNGNGGGNGFVANGTPGAPGGRFGGGITGQVKSVNGNVITLNIGQNEFQVNLDSSATILKADPAASSDLVAGDQIIVTGQRDAQGNMTASQIIILKTAQ